MLVPRRGITDGNAFQSNLFTGVEENALWPPGNALGSMVNPPVAGLCIAVDYSLSVNADIFHTDTGDKAGERIVGPSLPCPKHNAVFFFVGS